MLPLLRKYKLDVCIVLALFILTLAVRLPIAAERKIMPAGDAFNFQHIASYIRYFKYPAKEKRLPTYPIFILAGRAVGFDPIKTSIAISLVASAGTIVALYLLGRVLHFNRSALVAFLGLAMFDPLLIINAIRPLSDGLFVCLVATLFFTVAFFMRFPEKATNKNCLWFGVLITLLIFTRYEGFLIAGLTIPFLLIKIPLRNVLKIIVIPCLAVIAWVPAYISIHGSIGGLSYVTDATDSKGGFGEVAKIPENMDRLMNGAGWRRVWAYPQEVFEKKISIENIELLISNPNWWVGVLSLLGLVYIVISGGWSGAAILLSILGYALLLSWWWVYSRYVAPLSIIFYFSAAGGLSALVHAATLIKNKKIAVVGAALLPLIVIPIIIHEIPVLHASALSRAWESDRKGYGLYQALTFAGRSNKLTVYPTKEHANATLFLGVLDEKKSFKNPHHGMYLSDLPNAKAVELYDYLGKLKPKLFIDTPYDSRQPELVEILMQKKNVTATKIFRSVRWDTYDMEITNVYELQWP